MEKYGFVYIWYDKKRKMYYIGCHWGTTDDGYICSSNRMRDAYRRRPNDFKRRIIKNNVSRETLLNEEHKWLNKIKPEELGKRYYNLKKHKWGHWATDENKRLKIGQKISEKNKGKIGPNLGKKFSEESKKKMRESAKGRIQNENTRKKISEGNKGKKAWNKGYKMSNKYCEKLSQSSTKNIPINIDIIDQFDKKQEKSRMNSRNKPISTPYGEFQSVRDAARKLGIERKTIEYRLKSPYIKFGDWKYLNLELIYHGR